MKLRSIEMVVPDAAAAASFLVEVWGLAPAEVRGSTHYLRGAGSDPYLVALEEGPERFVRSVTFTADPALIAPIGVAAAAAGVPACAVKSEDPGGGEGVLVQFAEGNIFRFLAHAEAVAPLEGRDLPVQLTHIVLNAEDAEATAESAERILGFRVSDRTSGMVFVRCNNSHHSTAFARAGFASLNHIAFEMQDMDGVMRGIGRLRDHGMTPVWGPGRHGPGANVFAYYIAPFGAVIEFSTAVDKVDDNYRVGSPEDWRWPQGRIDQWGISNKDVDELGKAERNFRFRRDWEADAIAPSEVNA